MLTVPGHSSLGQGCETTDEMFHTSKAYISHVHLENRGATRHCKTNFNSDGLNLLPVTFHTGQSDVFTAGDASIGSITLLHYDTLDARPFFIACCSALQYLTTLLPRQVRSRNSLLFYSLPFFEWENCCPNVINKKNAATAVSTLWASLFTSLQ